MFRISKFQKIFNARKSKGTSFLSFKYIDIASRILFKMFAVSCVLIPCFFVIVQLGFADERLESNHSDFVAINSGLDDVTGISASSISKRVVREKPLLFDESRSEGGSGLVKLSDVDGRKVIKMGFSDEFSGKKVSNRTSDNNTNNCSPDTNNRVRHLFYGAFLGIGFFASILYLFFGLWFYFTQRQHQRERYAIR